MKYTLLKFTGNMKAIVSKDVHHLSVFSQHICFKSGNVVFTSHIGQHLHELGPNTPSLIRILNSKGNLCRVPFREPIVASYSCNILALIPTYFGYKGKSVIIIHCAESNGILSPQLGQRMEAQVFGSPAEP